GLLSWLIASVATVYLMPLGYRVALKVIASPLVAMMLSGALIFLVLLLLLLLLSDTIVAWTKSGVLRMLDRVLGVGFGALRALVFLWGGCWITLAIAPYLKVHPFLEHSQTFPFLIEGSEFLKDQVEKNLLFEKTVRFFKNELNPLLENVMDSHGSLNFSQTAGHLPITEQTAEILETPSVSVENPPSTPSISVPVSIEPPSALSQKSP
ncbi:MAG: CvpA family protein, partial [Holosporales bacterium]|nr:CvpA family protein [Holosporales bacterium]